MPDRDLGHEARHRADQLETFADEFAGSRCAVLEKTAKLLREMAIERERLRAALEPFAVLADTWTVQMAALSSSLLTVSNGARMCGIDAEAFVKARAALREQEDE